MFSLFRLLASTLGVREYRFNVFRFRGKGAPHMQQKHDVRTDRKFACPCDFECSLCRRFRISVTASRFEVLGL